MKQSTNAAATKSSYIAEDIDSLLKKVSGGSNTHTSRSIGPSVIKQKDDVVYISDPSPEWRYWSHIKIGDALALTISLQ